jgi:3-methylcrotonyl-CoA carboxylase alpha subunit
LFATLLIANRGEIACRIIRTARRLGIRTIAVYSTADAGALHVEMADEARAIGPAPARESYLDIAGIIAAAQRSGADAIHPGYGFLSENADFAAACEAVGIIFVGPPAAAIRSLGAKAEAKALMERAGVSVVPGYHGADQSEARFAAEAQRLGYPVLVKASSGGGGRGMRIVAAERELAQALAAARREAEHAFGDGRLILERHLAHPRHVEVQIFADRSGNVVHLFERDCSAQRRHQKVIEETPASLAAEPRAALLAAAVTAAKAGAYVGAGTVEFLVEGDAFHFIEMNTRLQVEHPVTEMITGVDLVEWQLRIAAGESLPLMQGDIAADGHAVEARLYAEDPARDFLPAAGTLTHFRLPDPAAGLRIETGVRAGDVVGLHYDPLLAKLVAWGEDREIALCRLALALAETCVVGVATNRDFLRRLVRHADFAAGDADTGFIAAHRDALMPPAAGASVAAVAAAGLFVAAEGAAAASCAAAGSGDPHSPWSRRDGWRLGGASIQELRFGDGAGERLVRIQHGAGDLRLEIDGRMVTALLQRDGADGYALELDGARQDATIVRQGMTLTVVFADETCRLIERDPLAPTPPEEDAAGRLTAPMPGKVLAVLVAPGAGVRRGQLLMVLEAMKMEHAITAPADGVVDAVHYAAGDLVEEGALLLAFAAAAGEG